MIMNGNVQHVSIHLSDTLWWLIKAQKCVVWPRLKPGCCNLSISRCIGSLRYRAKRYLGCHALSDMSSWATIKAFGLDRNADAAEGDWGLGVKKKRGGEREGGRNRPVSRKACPTNALHRGPKLPPTQWSYSQFRCPPHWQVTQHTKPWLTSPKCESASLLSAPSRDNSNSDRHK